MAKIRIIMQDSRTATEKTLGTFKNEKIALAFLNAKVRDNNACKDFVDDPDRHNSYEFKWGKTWNGRYISYQDNIDDMQWMVKPSQYIKPLWLNRVTKSNRVCFDIVESYYYVRHGITKNIVKYHPDNWTMCNTEPVGTMTFKFETV